MCQRVDDLLDGEMATCHPIRMEILAGARDEQHLSDLRRLLARASLLPTRATDYEQAAALPRWLMRALAEVFLAGAEDAQAGGQSATSLRFWTFPTSFPGKGSTRSHHEVGTSK